jgi:anti-anti-sigma regulatory factor
VPPSYVSYTSRPAALDLSAVTYGDSTFLEQLVRLQKRIRDVALVAPNARFNGVGIKLVGPNPNLQRVLKVVGFDCLFQIDDT